MTDLSRYFTPEQFREVAKRFRVILEYGVTGATLGDNEAARIIIACEHMANALEADGNRASRRD